MGRSKRRRSSSASSEESARYREVSERRYHSKQRAKSLNKGSDRESVSRDDCDSNRRINRLEKLVETLLKQNSSENSRHKESQIRYAVRSDCIPEFEPGNPNLTAEKWIAKIEQLADINEWDTKTMTYHMQNRLSGLAKTWYGNLSTYDRSWDEWKNLIKQSFPDHRDFATTLRKLVNRKKEEKESMTEYYYAKMELINVCKITGKDAVSCLIDGLQNSNLQTGARAGRYSTPEVLYSEFLSTIVEDIKPYQNTVYKRNDKDKRDRKRFYHRDQHVATSTQARYEKVLKCFNCGERGHIATKCAKPKLECTKCNRLGHDGNSCSYKVNRNALSCEVPNKKEKNMCYFVDCLINGKSFRGYVDTGCCAVMLRETDAKELRLKIQPCCLSISGYAGGSTRVTGEAEVDLTVDLANASVKILIVPDELQSVPIIIGQPFVNHDNVTLVVQNSEMRLFNKELAILPEIASLPPAKVALWAKETTVIPPHHAGYVAVYNDNNDMDVYVELRENQKPGQEHWISRCVTGTSNGAVLVFNVSKVPLLFKAKQTVTRGIPCRKDIEEKSVSNLTITTKQIKPFIMSDISSQIDESVSNGYKEKLLDLLNSYRDCFAQCLSELGKTQKCEMKIDLNSEKPIVYRPYRMAFSERQVVRNIVNDLLDNNIIRESSSPFSSPILLVKKKTGEYRMCIDYRKLNSNTIKDKYPMPRIDDLIDRVKGCSYFTSLDLAHGYHQIPLSEDSIEKTAFITPDGHYEYLRMPFGLANAPSVFQRMINGILGPLRFTDALAYMDDMLLPSTTIQDGLDKLRKILDLLRDANLTLKLEKCSFFKKKIDYLGYQISFEGIQPSSKKITAVSNFPKPSDIHQIRQFLGLASYFRRFVPNFASIACPLTKLLKKESKFTWTDEQQNAFCELKRRLTERPILALYENSAYTELHTDASKFGIGGILLQKQPDESMKPISYYSRTTSKEEQRFHSYELETLAVIESLKHFRIYLIGVCFKIVTDCSAVRAAFTKRDLIPRIGRWWLTTLEFDFTIEYRSGTKMCHVDALSRNPIQTLDQGDVLTIDITTDDWVLTAQLKDDRCMQLIDILKKKPTTKEEQMIHKEFVLKNNRLYKVTREGKRWVVPKSSRREVVMCHHDNAGHFSLEKTLEYIKTKYWFASMRKYVKKYIFCCLPCLYNKVPAGKQSGHLNVIEKVAVPFDTLHVDHLGPFVKSSQRKTHLLTVIDGFTKYIFLKAVPNTKVEPVIKVFDEIISTFGVPRRIICDRGSCFTSEKFTEYCTKLGIKRILNATATPRANGQAERYNRTILSSISSSNEDERKWDQTLPSIQWGLNITVNKTTGKSPYELLLGYVPRSPNDSYITNEVCEDKVRKLNEMREEASLKIRKNQASQKKYFDGKRTKALTYDVGQYVVVRRSKGSNDGESRKLLPKYSGPYVVTKVLDHDRYVIEDLPGATRSRRKYTGICPSDKLKMYQTLSDTDDNVSDETNE